MIKGLTNFNLADIFPESLKSDPDSLALAEAITPLLYKIFEQSQNVQFHQGIPDHLLDFIAYEKDVDYYDTSMSNEGKRALIERAQYVHGIKGTVAAVEEVVSIFFKNAKIREWFQYNGRPFFFRIETDEAFKSPSDIARVFRLIESTKNTRSRLEGIWFKGAGSIQIQAVKDNETDREIRLQPVCGSTIVGKWPTISTLGRIIDSSSIKLRTESFNRGFITYPFTSKIFAGQSGLSPSVIQREIKAGILEIAQSFDKSLTEYPAISQNLYPNQILTGLNWRFEQMTVSYGMKQINAISSYSRNSKTYYRTGQFFAGNGVMT